MVVHEQLHIALLAHVCLQGNDEKEFYTVSFRLMSVEVAENKNQGTGKNRIAIMREANCNSLQMHNTGYIKNL